MDMERLKRDQSPRCTCGQIYSGTHHRTCNIVLAKENEMFAKALLVEAQSQPRICRHCKADNLVTRLWDHRHCDLAYLVGADLKKQLEGK